MMTTLIDSNYSSSEVKNNNSTSNLSDYSSALTISLQKSSSSFEQITHSELFENATSLFENPNTNDFVTAERTADIYDNFNKSDRSSLFDQKPNLNKHHLFRKQSNSPEFINSFSETFVNSKLKKVDGQKVVDSKKSFNDAQTQNQAISTNTEPVNCKTETVEQGVSSQIDPFMMELECQILPFYNDLTAIEKRLSMKYSFKPYRLLLKQLTKEHNLLLLMVGKNAEDKALVVRKRGELMEQQQKQLVLEMEKKRQKKAEEQAEALRLAITKANELEKNQQNRDSDAPKQQVIASCQANFDELGREIGKKRSKRSNKRKRDPNRKPYKPKQKITIETSMQTVPEDYMLCEWCLQHIPPENQCGHVEICRAGVKLKQLELGVQSKWKQRNLDVEMRKRQRLGMPIKSALKQNATSSKHSNHPRSQSRNKHCKVSGTNNKNPLTKSRPNDQQRSQAEMSTFYSKLDEIHPNNVNAISSLMQKLCTEPKCGRLAIEQNDKQSKTSNIKCLYCKRIYCAKHREAGAHSTCQAIATADDEATTDSSKSIACGWSAQEKQEALKAAFRERKTYLKQLRTRN